MTAILSVAVMGPGGLPVPAGTHIALTEEQVARMFARDMLVALVERQPETPAETPPGPPDATDPA